MRFSTTLLVCALLYAGSASAQVTPYTSYRKLTTSNGFAPAVYDIESRRITSFRENMYRFFEPGAQTRELAFDLYLGLRVAGRSQWLTEVPLEEAAYEVGTGLIRTSQRTDGVRVTTTYVAPYTLDARALLVVAEVENTARDTWDTALFSLHNFHLGAGNDATEGEQIVWRDGGYVEQGTTMGSATGALFIKPLVDVDGRTAGAMNPFPIVNDDRLFGTVDDSGVMTDAVSGFQFDIANREDFRRNVKQTVAFVVAYAPDRNTAALATQIDNWVASRSPAEILEAERADWQAWHRAGVWPNTTDPTELEIAQQSLAILRMGQVREPGAPNGQILASLPPGMWDIAWVRDGLFAVRALTATGHHDEAQAALDFLIRGPTNDYESFIGRPYRISVARYYGNAREESDFNANGPNIELDGFGMYLEAAAEHVDAGRTQWFMANRSAIDDGIADVLVAFRDMKTGLIAADSSIWESHWDNGGRQRWVYTSGFAVIGLSKWADVLERHGAPPTRAKAYRRAAAEIKAGMMQHLIDPQSGALASSVEQLRSGQAFADAQAALILAPETFAPGSATGLATLDFLRSQLFLSNTTRRGYRRNDDGDLYDEREWVVIDLGISRALRVAGRTADADALLGWITGQAAVNSLLVPELFREDDGRYFGEIPMVGFGAGAYLLALIERDGTRPPVMQMPDAGLPDVPADAALPDATADVGLDAGTITDATATDTGTVTSRADANPVDTNPDAGLAAGSADAGTSNDSDEGCGCHVAPRFSQFELHVVWLLLLLALRKRR